MSALGDKMLSILEDIKELLTPKFRKKPNYSLYKPLPKADSGAAIQFKYAEDLESLFIEAARQRGERLPTGDKDQFDWDSKISFKLGLVDIGQMLLVLSGKKREVDLIHRSEKGSVVRTSAMKLMKQQKDKETGRGYDNYMLRLNKVETIDGNKGTPVSVQIYIDHHEMAIITIALRRATEKMLGLS